jgi:hypothetical protein
MTLEEKLTAHFHDGTLADAVEVLAQAEDDAPVVQSVLLEAASRLRWAARDLYAWRLKALDMARTMIEGSFEEQGLATDWWREQLNPVEVVPVISQSPTI